jgi:hypothetical protein
MIQDYPLQAGARRMIAGFLQVPLKSDISRRNASPKTGGRSNRSAKINRKRLYERRNLFFIRRDSTCAIALQIELTLLL